MRRRRRIAGAALVVVMGAIAYFWATPFIWMSLASFRPNAFGGIDMAALWINFTPTLANFELAWESAPFLVYYMNTLIVVMGILLVQLVTVTLAGYAFARLDFPLKDTLFYVFLLQLILVPPMLIVPNLTTIVKLGLYDTLVAVMAPYFGSAFGTFMMRQAFKTIPREFEDAALVEGCSWYQLIWYVMIPLVRPVLIAFGIVSVTFHWSEYLWPLMVTASPGNRTVTIGLAMFSNAAEGASDWGLIAAGTVLVIFPLLVAFLAFQRQFVSSFMFSGIK